MCRIIPKLETRKKECNDPAVLDKKTATDPTLMTLPKSQKITLYFFAYGMIILSAFYLNILSSYFGGFASECLGLSSAIIGIIVFCLPIGRGIAFTIMGLSDNTN